MIGRNGLIFIGILFGLSVAVAAAGLISAPPGVLALMAAHHNRLLPLLMVDWIVIPLALGLVLFSNPIMRLVQRGRAAPADWGPWMERSCIMIGLFLVVSQLIQSGGVIAFWNHLGAPETVDPAGRLTRLAWATAGALIAWFGNSLPKLSSPFKGAPAETYDWTGVARTCGWILVLGGLGLAVCAALLPLHDAAMAALAIVLATGVGATLAWSLYRFSGAQNAAP